MHLYHLTLQRAGNIQQAVQGNFSGTKQQEICVSTGRYLEILRPDPTTGKVYSLISVNCFACVRSIIAFRLTGGNKDYIVVGSDSGRITVLEYNPQKNEFDRVHMETFGKSGVRRIVPGQLLAMDPKGRAVMIGALEKHKLVYIFNRDTQARLTISSPLEAHKSNTLCFHMVGLDVGYENPVFACLELDIEEADSDPTGEEAAQAQQQLTFYELDLGLNYVVRKFSEPLPFRANMLISVPGGNDGPSGVLVCAESKIVYKNLGDQPDISIPIPRRKNDLDEADRTMLIVASATHKTKSLFFFLLQTEQGDLFKCTLSVDDDIVREIKLKYFDTVPVAASLCVLRTGFLFVASEFGNHFLYQIAHLGDQDNEPEFSSSVPLDEGETFFFAPRTLQNLVVVDEIDSLCPITACKPLELPGEDGAPQLCALAGRGARSSIKLLRHGLEVTEMAVSELPGNPNSVWTVRRHADESFDSYIVVSFVNASLVLGIGETVEEITDSGFLGSQPTLACGQLGQDALIQVYPQGIRHIRADRRVNEWRAPDKRSIIRCVINSRQVVVALTGRELAYFEIDPAGQLNEYFQRKSMSRDVVCMAIGRVPAGEQRSRFLAVGLADMTVRIISLNPNECLTPLATQALPALPESLSISGSMASTAATGAASSELYLFTGLHNGVLLRTKLDHVTGDLSDSRTRYLGSRPVKLFAVTIQGSRSLLAVSSRSWLCYSHQGRFRLSPLSYEQLDFASGFSSEQCPEGVVAISGNTLRILALEKLGGVFNQISHPLPLTPRRFVSHPTIPVVYVICTDHNSFTDEVRQSRKEQMAVEMVEAASAAGCDAADAEVAQSMADAFLATNLPDDTFYAPKAGPAMWASVLVSMKPESGEHVQAAIAFEQNEAAHSIAMAKFFNAGHVLAGFIPGGLTPAQMAAKAASTHFLVIGTSKDLKLQGGQATGGFLHTYRVEPSGVLVEMHVTPVEGVPGAMAAFQGRLLVSVGKTLRLYELGKKKLLRKTECRHAVPRHIVDLHVSGDRIVATDVQESVHWCVFRRGPAGDAKLALLADETNPRFTVASCLLDHHSMAGSDKFGNLFVLRLAQDTDDSLAQAEDEIAPHKGLWDRGFLNGAAIKAECCAQMHLGETVTSLCRTSLIPTGSGCVVYTTLSGSVGVLLPLASKDDHDFLQLLELHLRQEHPIPSGREHVGFVSRFFPVKNIIDGDLCEIFTSLPAAKQKTIADDFSKNPNDIAKKLEDIRARYAF